MRGDTVVQREEIGKGKDGNKSGETRKWGTKEVRKGEKNIAGKN